MSESLIEKFKRVRKERGLTLVEISFRMRLPRQMVSNFENGKAVLTPQQADVIRAFLGGKL